MGLRTALSLLIAWLLTQVSLVLAFADRFTFIAGALTAVSVILAYEVGRRDRQP